MTGSRTPLRDEYWQAIDGEDRAATLQAPVLLMAGWFDPFLPGSSPISSASGATRGATWQAPPVSSSAPGRTPRRVALPGAAATRNYRLESLAPSIPWFDRHLTGRWAPASRPDSPVRLYVMGANVWRDEPEWPLARARA